MMKRKPIFNKHLPTAKIDVVCRICGNIEKVAIQVPDMFVTLYQTKVTRKGEIKFVPKRAI